jgi:hypothetical protein
VLDREREELAAEQEAANLRREAVFHPLDGTDRGERGDRQFRL